MSNIIQAKLWLYLAFFVSKLLSNKPCSPAPNDGNCRAHNNSEFPHFTKAPEDMIWGYDSQIATFHCCMDGYTQLLWSFRKLNSPIWEYPYKCLESDQNMTLVLNYPYSSYDTGYYRCTATDTAGNHASHCIFLYLKESETKPNLTLIPFTSSPETSFEMGFHFNLSCFAESYLSNEKITVHWLDVDHANVDAGKQIGSRATIETTIINNTNSLDEYCNRGSNTSEVHPFHLQIKTSLIVKNLQSSDQSNYKCEFRQQGQIVGYNFSVHVVNNKLSMIILAAILSAGVLVVALAVIAWHCHYRTVLFCKTYLDLSGKGMVRQYDISLLYAGDFIDDAGKDCGDGGTMEVAIWISQRLENHKFQCWLSDRDQRFGVEVSQDLPVVLDKSHVVLVVVTKPNYSMLKILSGLSLNPSIKRIYLLNPSKKAVLQDLKRTDMELYIWMQRELRFQFMLLAVHHSWTKEHFKSHTKDIMAWILASLPSQSIRRLRKPLQAS